MKRRFLKRSLLLLLALSCLLLAACGKEKPVDFTTAPLEQEESQMTQPSETGEVDNLMPWEKEGAKHPAEYTLEEYEALTAEQRKAFRDWMGAAGYAEWLEMAEADPSIQGYQNGVFWERNTLTEQRKALNRAKENSACACAEKKHPSR